MGLLLLLIGNEKYIFLYFFFFWNYWFLTKIETRFFQRTSRTIRTVSLYFNFLAGQLDEIILAFYQVYVIDAVHKDNWSLHSKVDLEFMQRKAKYYGKRKNVMENFV